MQLGVQRAGRRSAQQRNSKEYWNELLTGAGNFARIRTKVGTAMGIAGTEVAKAAADMVLLDDQFPWICFLGVKKGE